MVIRLIRSTKAGMGPIPKRVLGFAKDLAAHPVFDNRARAQSEVIGVVLLTAVIIILSVLVGVTILSTVDTSDEPTANLAAEIDGGELVLSHRGGSELSTGEITVILQNGGRQRLPLGNFSGDDSDGRFTPGEQLSHSYGVVDSLRVLIVHKPSNTVLYDRVIDAPASGTLQSK